MQKESASKVDSCIVFLFYFNNNNLKFQNIWELLR